MRLCSARRKSSQRFPLLVANTDLRSFRWSAARIMIHFLCRASLRWPCYLFRAETGTATGQTSTLLPKILNAASWCWQKRWRVWLPEIESLSGFRLQDVDEKHGRKNGAPGARRGGELSTFWFPPKAGIYRTGLRKLLFEQFGNPGSSPSCFPSVFSAHRFGSRCKFLTVAQRPGFVVPS